MAYRPGYGRSQPPQPSPPPQPLTPAYRVRLEAIGDAWKIVIADVGNWVLISLVYMGGTTALFVPIYIWMFASVLSAGGTLSSRPPGSIAPDPFPFQFFGQFFIVILVFSFVIAFAGSVWLAASMRFGLLKARGIPVAIGDFFKLDGMVGPILTFYFLYMASAFAVNGLIMGLVGGAAALVFHASPILGAVIIGIGYVFVIILGLIYQALLLFAPLLIIDRKLPPLEAAKLSATTIWPHIWPTIGVYFCAALLSGLGHLACGIGLLVTLPILYVTTAVMYNDFFPAPVPAVAEFVEPVSEG